MQSKRVDPSVILPGATTATVLEVGNSIAVGVAGANLRDLGADVTVASIASDADRVGADTSHYRPPFEFLQSNKRCVTFADVSELGSRSSSAIVIADLPSMLSLGFADSTESYCEKIRELNTGVWVTVSPWGLSGPNARYRGSELTVASSGGMVAYCRDKQGRPVLPAGYQASWLTGGFAAMAALHGLWVHETEGRPVHIDLSGQEAVIAAGSFMRAAGTAFDVPAKEDALRRPQPHGPYPCKDGLVYMLVMEDHQWRGLVEAFGNPSWTDAVETRTDRVTLGALIDEHVSEWTAARTIKEVCRLQEWGVPVTPVNSCARILDSPEETRFGFVEEVITPRGSAKLPGVPVIATPGRPAIPDGETGETTHDRNLVVSLTTVLVGPLATSWLGALGFDVLQIEDPTRIDVYRRKAPFADGINDLEHGMLFAATNYAKRSVAVDLSTDEGRAQLERLCARAGVIVENLSTSRATKIGLSEYMESAGAGDKCCVSISGFGRKGPLAHYRAYGHNVTAHAGLLYHTRGSDGEMCDADVPLGDAVTAIWVGMLVAAWRVWGESGVRFDIAMVEALSRQLSEFFVAQSRDHRELLDSGVQRDSESLQGVYLTRTEATWIAVTIETLDELELVCEFLAAGKSAELSDSSFGDNPSKIHAVLENGFRGVEAEDAFRSLCERGVAVAIVRDGVGLHADDHLRCRDVFQLVSHPAWGERRLSALPWREALAAPAPRGRAPLFGEHTDEVFEQLGIDTAVATYEGAHQ